MLSLVSRITALLIPLALLPAAALAQGATQYKELPNFQKVSERLYRGGQPRSGGIKKLAELGVRTVINLRGEDGLTRREKQEAEAAGLRYFGMPMAGWGRPGDDQVARIMAIIDAPENWPVFIHCKRGSDRTGTVAAIYRITHDGWTGHQAVAEASRHGMSWMSIWMKDYISDFYRDYSRAATPASGQGIEDKVGRYMRGVEFMAVKTHSSLRRLFGMAGAH
jgi:uncharacterized protein (TIGR01244 family)